MPFGLRMPISTGPTRLSSNQRSGNLQQLLEDISSASEDTANFSVENLLQEIGSRSFGPLLVLAGLVVLAPLIGDIPGVPTVIGLFVFLLALQLLLGKKHLWLPKWLLKKEMSAEKLRTSLKRLDKPTRYIDRLLRPRLSVLVSDRAVTAMALTCILVALSMPMMEFIPFSANIAGAVLTAFGLSLISKDGALALAAFVVTAITVVAAVFILL
jgi:hypothetical protein